MSALFCTTSQLARSRRSNFKEIQSKPAPATMGAVNSVRKLTVDSLALLEQLEPNTAELVAKSAVRLRVQQLLQQKWPTCRVLPFGSSESGLGFGGCDVDLGIYFEDVDVDAQGQYLPQERINLLTSACEHLSGVYEVQQFVRNARVPVIKLWDPKQQVAFDVCVGGINALLNTAFLKHFGWMDPRVRPLVFAVKFWAKQRGINDSVNGMLSSYGYTLLLIFYLQSQHAEMQLPMALAHFYNLQSQKKLSVLLEGLQSFPAMDSPSTYGISEMESVGALLAGFFDFFAYRFNMEDEVVSIRMGKAVSKTTKWSHPSSWRLSIEDPFELAHDVGRVIFHRKGQEIIHSEFKRASTLLSKNYRLADICVPDHSSWNIVSSCYICCCKGHVTRRCGQLVRRHSSSVTSTFSDCWYCGDHGHYKAECPMLFFRSIPCLIKAADDYKILAKATSKPKCETISLSLVGIAKAPTSILIPVPSFPKAPWSKVCTDRISERGLTPLSSPMLRLSKKKKRARHSPSTFTFCSSPLSMSKLAPIGVSQTEKRQQQQRYQQRYQQQRLEQRRRNFALHELTRRCASSARSDRPQVIKLLCPT